MPENNNENSEPIQHYLYITSSYPAETYIKDGDTTNPITVNGTEITVTPGDYVRVKNYQKDDPMVIDYVNTYNEYFPDYYEDCTPLYVYTNGGNWIYTGLYHRLQYNYNFRGKNIFNSSAYTVNFLDTVDNWAHQDSDILGQTSNQVVTRVATYEEQGEDPETYHSTYFIEDMDTHYKLYGSWQETGTETSNTITTEAQYGDFADFAQYHENWSPWAGWYINAVYQYPGVWVDPLNFPDLTVQVPEEKYKGHVQLKWTDPPDITDWKPTPATWEGTVIVRKENSAPLHRWDGDKVVRTTTRDKYKSKPYKDEDIETNKVYYYAFMPYYTKIDDPQHSIRYYTFTKCIRVETGTISYIPEIIKIDMDEDVATITYAITLPATGPYDTAKLYGKKDDNPACDNTDDVIEDLNQVDNEIVVTDIDGDYYFCIQVANGTDTLTSDVVGCSGESASPIIIIDIPCLSIPKSIEYFTTPPTGLYEDGREAFSRLGYDLYDSTKAKNTYYTNWQNDDIRIRSRNNNYGYAQTNILDRREGGTSYDLGSHATIPSGSTDSGCYLSIGLDRADTSKIYLFTVQQTNNNWIYYLSKTIDNSDLYSLLYTLV